VCTCVNNQRRRGVVIASLRSSVQSLLHQRQDLHQSTYLFLVEDQEPTSHHPRVPVLQIMMIVEAGQ
jgi:hypothetical protein